MEKKPESLMSLEEKISRLSILLAKVGCENSENFLWREIVPIMENKGCSIIEAINIDIDVDADEAPHFHEISMALGKIPKTDLEFLM